MDVLINVRETWKDSQGNLKGKNHKLFTRGTAAQFKPKKQVVQKVPDGYREISRKKKVIAGAKHAVSGAEKSIDAAGRDLDWFFAPAAAKSASRPRKNCSSGTKSKNKNTRSTGRKR